MAGIIEDAELSKGRQVYVQINGNRVALSIDGPNDGHTFWLTMEDLELVNAACKLALNKKESYDGRTPSKDDEARN